MCRVCGVLLGHVCYLLFVYSKEVMSCGLFCTLKIYPLWESFYRSEKGQKNSSGDAILKKRNWLLEKGISGSRSCFYY